MMDEHKVRPASRAVFAKNRCQCHDRCVGTHFHIEFTSRWRYSVQNCEKASIFPLHCTIVRNFFSPSMNVMVQLAKLLLKQNRPPVHVLFPV